MVSYQTVTSQWRKVLQRQFFHFTLPTFLYKGCARSKTYSSARKPFPVGNSAISGQWFSTSWSMGFPIRTRASRWSHKTLPRNRGGDVLNERVPLRGTRKCYMRNIRFITTTWVILMRLWRSMLRKELLTNQGPSQRREISWGTKKRSFDNSAVLDWPILGI